MWGYDYKFDVYTFTYNNYFKFKNISDDPSIDNYSYAFYLSDKLTSIIKHNKVCQNKRSDLSKEEILWLNQLMSQTTQASIQNDNNPSTNALLSEKEIYKIIQYKIDIILLKTDNFPITTKIKEFVSPSYSKLSFFSNYNYINSEFRINSCIKKGIASVPQDTIVVIANNLNYIDASRFMRTCSFINNLYKNILPIKHKDAMLAQSTKLDKRLKEKEIKLEAEIKKKKIENEETKRLNAIYF